MYILNLENFGKSVGSGGGPTIDGEDYRKYIEEYVNKLLNDKSSHKFVESLPQAGPETISTLYFILDPDDPTKATMHVTHVTTGPSGNITSYNWIHLSDISGGNSESSEPCVTEEEKDKWNNKLNYSVNEENEELIINRN